MLISWLFFAMGKKAVNISTHVAEKLKQGYKSNHGSSDEPRGLLIPRREVLGDRISYGQKAAFVI